MHASVRRSAPDPQPVPDAGPGQDKPLPTEPAPDLDVAGPGPDPGSAPRSGDPVLAGPNDPPPSTGGGVRAAVLSYLNRPGAGAQLFVSGLVGLILAIGGLVAVGLRRRRW